MSRKKLQEIDTEQYKTTSIQWNFVFEFLL